MNNIALEIRKLLAEKSMSIEKLAKEIGWSRTGLHKAMMNNSFKLDTLEKISEAMEVDITYFFNDQKSEPSHKQKAIIEELNKKIASLESQLKDKAELIESKNKEIASLAKYKDFCDHMKPALEIWAETTGQVMIGIHPLEDRLIPIIYFMEKTLTKEEYKQCLYMALLK